MKRQNFIAKILTFMMIIGVLFTLASCGGGSLKLESFVVDTSTIKTSYNVGDEVDFDGIKAYAKYTDAKLNKTYTKAELQLDYDSDITATAGSKKLTVSFKDPNFDNKVQTATVTIIVTDPSDVVVDAKVTGYQIPAALTTFRTNNKAGTLSYGSSGFMGEFIKGGAGYLYIIGDDNEFKFLPEIDVELDGIDETLSMFHADITISLFNGEGYDVLKKEVNNSNIASFYIDVEGTDTLFAEVDTLKNTYDFTDAAVGKQIKISVLPSTEYYEYGSNITPVVLEAKVIDAYNVYEAWQLAVIDNFNEAWDEIKTDNGIKDFKTAGIVLHNDIKLTSNDVPASFFKATTAEVVYTNKANPDAAPTIIPEGTLYLYDGTVIYHRKDASDFSINGNFFNLDISAFPLVPSHGVFGPNSQKDYDNYGDDFSNATLIRIESSYGATEQPDDVSNITVDNISLIGNAKRDNLIDSQDKLASAGGLIFIKSAWYTDMDINNVIGNSFFITYFVNYSSSLVANDVKCYDSYQNAAMAWGDAYLEFNNSYLNGCGGPVIIAQSVVDDSRHPTVVTKNTIAETYLEGEEPWFEAVNATSTVSSIKALAPLLQANGLGTFINPSTDPALNGMLNIKGLLMTDGTNATEIIKDPSAQGKLIFNGEGIDRFTTGFWNNIVNHPAYNAEPQGAPFFSVVDENGNAHYLFYSGQGTTLCDVLRNPFSASTHADIYNAFLNADCIALSQGGISVVFEFYHAN